MAIDRAEAIGLSATVGGHGLILAALYFGIFGMEEKIEKPAALTVTLEGEGSPLPVTGEVGDANAAPEFVEEAEAELEAAADEADDTADEAAKAEAEAARAAAAARAANATAEEKRKAKEAADRAARKRREAEVARKRREKADRDRKRKEAEARRRREEAQNELEGVGSGLGGNDKKKPGQIKKEVSIALGSQIKSKLDRCVTDAPEIERLIFPVTVNLTRSGVVTSHTIGSPAGVTSTNRNQVTPVRECIAKAIRGASPFRGLDPEYYNIWKSHPMRLKPG